MTRYDEYPNVEARDADWQGKAIKWSAFVIARGKRVREDFDSLAGAARCAAEYEAICARNGLPDKRAFVYAITAEGHSTLVSRDEWTALAQEKSMKTYSFTMSGTSAGDQTWTTSGTVECEWAHVFKAAMQKSFADLTQGKAVFGKPGVGCNGPYDILELKITKGGS